MGHSTDFSRMTTVAPAEPTALPVDAASRICPADVPVRDAEGASACNATADAPPSATAAARSRASRRERASTDANEVIPTSDASVSPRQNLRPGDPGFGRTRHPPIPERIGAAASVVLDEDLGEFVSLVLRGVKSRSIPVTAARLLLERLLPSGRPIRLNLPVIRSADDLDEAQRIILQAVNDGRVTPGEARELQTVVAEAWKARLEAHDHPELGRDEKIGPEIWREQVCMAAQSYGMVWPDGEQAA